MIEVRPLIRGVMGVKSLLGGKLTVTKRSCLGVLLILVLLSNVSLVYAQSWTTLGTDSSGDAYFNETADAEAQDAAVGAGAISSGTYVNTQASDDSREVLIETKTGGRFRLGWIYTFSSLSNLRDDTRFYIEARLGATAPENMDIQWATDTGGPWTTLVTITSTTESVLGPYDIPSDTSTILYIRVLDTVTTDSAGGDVSTIEIDHMYIRSLFNEVDKTGLYFYNDGTYAYFKEELAAAPAISAFTYTVYLDKPTGGYSEDFRMTYSDGTTKLEKWDGSQWVNQASADITVSVGTGPNSITFKVKLTDIANPSVQEDTGVWFIEYHGANSYTTTDDRAPNAGSYSISSVEIPDLPWPTPLFFIPAVIVTVYILYKRRFK